MNKWNDKANKLKKRENKLKKGLNEIEKRQLINDVNIIKNRRIGLLINERFVNLPEELIAPALNFVINEMDECIEINNDKSNKKIQ